MDAHLLPLKSTGISSQLQLKCPPSVSEQSVRKGIPVVACSFSEYEWKVLCRFSTALLRQRVDALAAAGALLPCLALPLPPRQRAPPA
eukprot:4867143-Pleurochrysis_carterae.AAC.1